MTIFYPDVSNNNWGNENWTQQGQDNLYTFLSTLEAQGFSGVCHKMSQGNSYIDPYGALCQTWCEQNNFPFIGYHWVTEDDPASQVRTWQAAGGALDVMLDVEAGPPSSGDINNFWAVVNAFNNAGIFVQLAYLPQWYWGQIGSPALSLGDILLVSSGYPDGTGFASGIYANSGGDSGEGWAPYGGATPTMWQFTSSATVGNGSVIGVDVNAFRGDAATLAAIFAPGNGTNPTPAPPPPPAPPPAPTPGGPPVADASTIQADVSGVQPDGTPEPWRLVAARHPRNIGDIVNDPTRGAWNSTHNGQSYPGTFDAFEQQVATAEQLSWTHKFSDGIVRDSGDVLIELMEFAIEWRKANNLPTTAAPAKAVRKPRAK